MSRHSSHQARSPTTSIQTTERQRLGNKCGGGRRTVERDGDAVYGLNTEEGKKKCDFAEVFPRMTLLFGARPMSRKKKKKKKKLRNVWELWESAVSNANHNTHREFPKTD